MNKSKCTKEELTKGKLKVFSKLFHIFSASNMPAFRQVGEKQLPNPVLCMAWSPKRDLIALANTTGEVRLKP